jgi:hypothetical protein
MKMNVLRAKLLLVSVIVCLVAAQTAIDVTHAL